MGRYIASEVKPNPGISDTKNIFGTGQYRIFTSSRTWTVPPGTGTVRVSVLGAGGSGGGQWAAHQSICVGTILRASGSAGGGGGYGVGVASVVPGCVCCIVVGAGAVGGAIGAYYWNCVSGNCCSTNTGSLCASDGGAGGYSCGFGICATGGGAGLGGRCWTGALDAAALSCTTLPTSASVAGGAGGTAYGTFITYNGGAGTSADNTSGGGGGINDRNYYSGRGYVCANFTSGQLSGGSSGSPLGAGYSSGSVPLLFGAKAFDGSSDSTETLILKYDLPFPRWDGQIVYTQAGGTNAGNPGSDASVTVAPTTTRPMWGGQNAATTCNLYCWNSPGAGCCNTITCSKHVVGCGGGAGNGKRLTGYTCDGSTCYLTTIDCSPSTNGGNGLVILEW